MHFNIVLISEVYRHKVRSFISTDYQTDTTKKTKNLMAYSRLRIPNERSK